MMRKIIILLSVLLMNAMSAWSDCTKVGGLASNLAYEYPNGEHRWPGIVTVDMESPLNYTKDWGERGTAYLSQDFTGNGIMIGDILHVFYYKVQKVRFIRFQKGADGTWSHIKTSGGSYAEKGADMATTYPLSMSYDHQSDVLYGFRNGADMVNGNRVSTIYTINRENGDMTKSGTLDIAINSLFSDIKGNMYATDSQGDLYRVNIIGGTTSLIGSTGLESKDILSCCVDNATGKFIVYYINTMGGENPALYEIDPQTGAATKTVEIPHSEFGYLRSIWSVSDAAEGANGKPGLCSDLTFEPSTPGSHSGKFRVTAPSLNIGREPLTGLIDIDIYVDDAKVTGIKGAKAGETVESEGFTFASGRTHTVTAIPHNEIGEGAPSSQAIWVGYDHPSAPSDLTLQIDGDGKWTSSWTPPAVGTHGMPVDIDNLEYEVSLVPGNEMTVTDTPSAAGTIESTGSNNYHLEVCAIYEDLRSDAARSNVVEYGEPYAPPYYQPFAKDISIYEHIVRDVNGNSAINWRCDADGYTTVAMGQSSTGSTDIYLFTPPVRLSKDAEYSMTVKAASNFSLDAKSGQNLEITVCPDTNPDNAHKIAEARDLEQYFLGYTDVTGTYSPEEDCVVRFAIRNTASLSYSSGILVMDYLIDCTSVAPGAPAEVNDLKATPGAEGALSANLEFTLPLYSESGSPITSLSSVKIYRDGLMTPVHEIPNPEPGEKIEWTDNITDGLHQNRKWEIRAFNDSGCGSKAECSAWVGEYIADAPQDFRISQTNTAFNLTWDKPLGSIEPGRYVDTDNLKYTVMVWYDPMEFPTILQTDIMDTECSIEKSIFHMLGGDRQIAMTFYVYGVSPAGNGSPAVADIVAGVDYSLPFEESFDTTYGTSTTPWGVRDMPDETRPYEQCWYPLAEGSSPSDVISQDKDGAMAMFYQKNYNTYESRLISPSIFFDGPSLMTFHVWHRECSDNNKIQIELLSSDNEGRDLFTSIGSPIMIGRYGGWTLWNVYLDPADFGNAARIVFHGSGENNIDFYIDNIRVDKTDMTRPVELVWTNMHNGVADALNDMNTIMVINGAVLIPGGEWHIYSTDGKSIASGSGPGHVKLEPGMYVICTESGSQKAHIR